MQVVALIRLLIHTGRNPDGVSKAELAMVLGRAGPKMSAEQEEGGSAHRGQARRGKSQGGLLRTTGDLCLRLNDDEADTDLARSW
jgi:hypothetical protein